MRADRLGCTLVIKAIQSISKAAMKTQAIQKCKIEVIEDKIVVDGQSFGTKSGGKLWVWTHFAIKEDDDSVVLCKLCCDKENPISSQEEVERQQEWSGI